MKALQRCFTLLPRGLGTPKGPQRRRIAFLFPSLTFQRLFPYLPVIPASIVDLVQRKIAPVDPKLSRQRFLYAVQPLRGSIDVGSNIVNVNVELDHGTLPFLRCPPQEVRSANSWKMVAANLMPWM